MNHSNFNFDDAFDFDDDTHVFAFQVATVVVAEEESNNQGRRTGYRGSILGHNIVNHNRKKGELRLYDDYDGNHAITILSIIRLRLTRRAKRGLIIMMATMPDSWYWVQHDPKAFGLA